MCGIVGVVGTAPAAPLLLEALKRLEYRGYDSAGIATIVSGHIERRRAEGKLANLDSLLKREPLAGTTGIGHTRWATHGAPTERNAHPHATERVAVVHNGIIENFQELRDELEKTGRRFSTDTDTEVVAHLLTVYLDEGRTPEAAMEATLKRLEGAFAIAVLIFGREDVMLAARHGPPLALGFGDGEMFVGSDALALAPLTKRICYLEDGDWAILTHGGAVVRDREGRTIERPIKETAFSGALIGKGNYRHFMHKEIHEQPAVIGDTLRTYLNPATLAVGLPGSALAFASIPKVTLVACGTSFHAAMVAKYWLEQVARVPVEIDIASEFRYRGADMPAGGLAVVISQSGETADTLAALRYAKAQGQTVVAVVNVPESTIAREADLVLPTHAGPEIGVASTKAFTTQLAVLACFALVAAKSRGKLDKARAMALAEALIAVPAHAAAVLNHDEALQALAHEIVDARDVIYLGRGTSYPVALEGALKLKEISYIHAEGYAAGEMKHGPIALIAEDVPVIVVAPSDPVFDKTASNVQEVAARGGKVVLITDKPGVERLGRVVWRSIEMPEGDPFVSPLLYSIPVQLLAYHVAVLKGTDVDQPRNLAKSVTVE
jgi:glucosamine--fructose-6-phosphate aminotransferase (isomerizing)